MIEVKALCEQWGEANYVFIVSSNPTREFSMVNLETGETGVLLVGPPQRPLGQGAKKSPQKKAGAKNGMVNQRKR